jgi:hypothetical protein
VKRGYKDNTYARESRNDRAIFGGSCCFKSSVLQKLLRLLYKQTPLFKRCRWAIGAMPSFRSGVISI